jgi:hypothetical protein
MLDHWPQNPLHVPSPFEESILNDLLLCRDSRLVARLGRLRVEAQEEEPGVDHVEDSVGAAEVDSAEVNEADNEVEHAGSGDGEMTMTRTLMGMPSL